MIELITGIIDVFADSPLSGNPLAVVENADQLDDDQMRRIAREFNQAETTFIMRSERADRKLRSFTASGSEVFGAGHNALGAWLWMAERGDLGPISAPQTFMQEIGEDVLPIQLERIDGRIHGLMRQAPLRLLEPLDEVGPLAKALALDPAVILKEPEIRPADTGAAHLMVRVRDAATVDEARPDADKLLLVLKSTGAEGCYVYALQEAQSSKAYARFFNPTVGLWEDAATGTAAGPLAAYLAQAGIVQGNKLVVEQGTKMGRRSLLRVQLTPNPELSGTGIVVLQGVLRL
ncbi:MAG: PhzF family phenazine biosynthesis protein [Telluria sp.]